MSGPGDTLYALWTSATEKAKQAAAAVSRATERAFTAVGEAEMRRAEVDRQMAQAQLDLAKQGLEKLKAAGVAFADFDRWMTDGINQSFTGGPKGFVCMPCWFYITRFSKYNGQQFRICTTKDGKQTIEMVERNPDGKSYRVTGVVPSTNGGTNGDYWNEPPTSPPFVPYNVPAPSNSHVNGINVTPAAGLQDALAFQREIRARCPGKFSPGGGGGAGGGSAGGRGTSGGGGAANPGAASCEACECVLYTYSANLGIGMDLVQSAAAKGLGPLNWNGQVTNQETLRMQDAVRNKTPITVSAHSRGSLLEENAWNNTFEGLREGYKTSPEAVAAGNAAMERALAWPSDGMTNYTAIRNMEINRVASEKAAADMNRYVRVVSSGNAVAFYNPYEKGTRLVTMAGGMTADFVTRNTGSIVGGQMRTEPVPVSGFDPMYHTFGKYYVGPAADEICNPGK